MSNWLVVTGITFAVFFTEALIHYNYGIRESRNENMSFKNFQIPKGTSLLTMATIVIVASTISGSLITYTQTKM